MSLLTNFDETDFEAPRGLPARSVLFSLQPHGVGTAQQESLISLLVRTSHAHGVNPRLLIKEVLAKSDPNIARLSTAAFFQTLAGTLNGLGKYAEMVTFAMEELTGQPNLQHLTMLPWRNFFPHNGQGLLARQPRWCPICIHQQQRRGEITTFPLLWSLEAYQTCLVHQVQLEHRCPSCGCTQRFIPSYPDLTLCSRCRRSLDRIGSGQTTSHFQSWVAEAVADMVARQSTNGFVPSLVRFREFVSECVAAHTRGNRTAFCRALGFNNFGVSGWLNKNQRPSITQFLTLCYGTRTMPTDIFYGSQAPVPTAGLRLPLSKLKDRSACPRPMAEQKASFKKHLQACLKLDDGRSVKEIAKELCVSTGCLRYWFPELCRSLSDRHRAEARKRSDSHRARQCMLVDKMIKRIREEGNQPSKRLVDRMLRSDGISLSQPHLMMAYRKTLAPIP